MFEGSLVESRGLAGSGTKRWTALSSVVVQGAVAGLLVAIPLLRPEALPLLSVPSLLPVPVPPRPPVVRVKIESAAAAASEAMSLPANAVPLAAAPSLLPRVYRHIV